MTPPPPPIPQTPIPVQPLMYTGRDESRRPGFITAIAVSSICIACITLVGSGFWVLMSLGFGLKYSTTFSSTTSSISSASTTQPFNAPELISEDGLPAAKRAVLIAAFNESHAMTAAQRRQLDSLLAESGKKVFPAPIENLSYASLRANISQSGDLSDDPGAIYFLTGAGRVELSDQKAVFISRSGTTHRASANSTSSPAPSLTLPEAAAARIEALAGTKLTPAQRQSVEYLLASSNQNIVVGTTPASVNQIFNAYSDPSGVTFMTAGHTITLPPTGGNTVSTTSAASVSLNRWSIAGVVADALLSAAASILLLIAGIFMLRQSLRARLLHLIYCAVKLIAAAIGAVAWISLQRQVSSGPSSPTWATAVFIALCFVIGAAYPIVLLVLLNLPVVRLYYSPEPPIPYPQ